MKSVWMAAMPGTFWYDLCRVAEFSWAPRIGGYESGHDERELSWQAWSAWDFENPIVSKPVEKRQR